MKINKKIIKNNGLCVYPPLDGKSEKIKNYLDCEQNSCKLVERMKFSLETISNRPTRNKLMNILNRINYETN